MHDERYFHPENNSFFQKIKDYVLKKKIPMRESNLHKDGRFWLKNKDLERVKDKKPEHFI